MIVLASATDELRITYSSTYTLDTALQISVSYVDYAAPSTYTPGRVVSTSITPTATATTSAILTCPASTYRAVKTLSIQNLASKGAVKLVVSHYDGTNAAQLFSANVPPGSGKLEYHEGKGFVLRAPAGFPDMDTADWVDNADVAWLATASSVSTIILALPAVVNLPNTNGGTVAVIEKLDALRVRYPREPSTTPTALYFKFVCFYKVDATTTGAALACAPLQLTAGYGYSWIPTSTTAGTLGYTPATPLTAAVASSAATGGNVAIIEGIYTFGTTSQTMDFHPHFVMEFGGGTTRELSQAIFMLQYLNG